LASLMTRDGRLRRRLRRFTAVRERIFPARRSASSLVPGRCAKPLELFTEAGADETDGIAPA